MGLIGSQGHPGLREEKGRHRDRAYFMLRKSKQPSTRREQDGAQEESGSTGERGQKSKVGWT